MATDPASIVEAIDAAVLVAATRGFPLTYSIAGRSLTFRSMAELTDLRTYYQNLVRDQTEGSKRSRARLPGGPPR